MPGGWVKLYRKLLDSDMWQQLTSKQRDVMIACLLKANHEGKRWEWKGKVFDATPGQFVTSLESLRDCCGKDVSVQSVRTAIFKLEMWGFLTNESTKTGRLITIVNWRLYQEGEPEVNKPINRQSTDSQQTANKQLTTNKNDKELYKKKDIECRVGEEDDVSIPYLAIVEHLNRKAHTKYRHSSNTTRTLIHARWEDGFRFEDFQSVIDNKCADWLDDEKMCAYLRPQTLFGTKFESYLNSKPKGKKQKPQGGGTPETRIEYV